MAAIRATACVLVLVAAGCISAPEEQEDQPPGEAASDTVELPIEDVWWQWTWDNGASTVLEIQEVQAQAIDSSGQIREAVGYRHASVWAFPFYDSEESVVTHMFDNGTYIGTEELLPARGWQFWHFPVDGASLPIAVAPWTPILLALLVGDDEIQPGVAAITGNAEYVWGPLKSGYCAEIVHGLSVGPRSPTICRGNDTLTVSVETAFGPTALVRHGSNASSDEGRHLERREPLDGVEWPRMELAGRTLVHPPIAPGEGDSRIDGLLTSPAFHEYWLRPNNQIIGVFFLMGDFTVTSAGGFDVIQSYIGLSGLDGDLTILVTGAGGTPVEPPAVAGTWSSSGGVLIPMNWSGIPEKIVPRDAIHEAWNYGHWGATWVTTGKVALGGRTTEDSFVWAFGENCLEVENPRVAVVSAVSGQPLLIGPRIPFAGGCATLMPMT